MDAHAWACFSLSEISDKVDRQLLDKVHGVCTVFCTRQDKPPKQSGLEQ
jgi:hypothetical protein